MNAYCHRPLRIAVLVAALSVLVILTQAGENHAGPGSTETQSKLWLVGDSSLHVYSSTAHHLKAEFAFSPDKPAYEQLREGELKMLEVVVPVKEMRSGKNGLDKNMQKALKAGENPDILFHLTNFKVALSTSESPAIAVEAAGTLDIAGVKKDAVLDGVLTPEARGARIQGSKVLLMTDFGVKPPKILMIKTYDEVTVHYDLWLDEKGQLK